MEKILEEQISILAISNYSHIELFQKYNIDFYCSGNLTLIEALINAKVDKLEFLNDFYKTKVEKIRHYTVNIYEWPLDLLADYIQKTHHKFTDDILMKIKSAVNNCLNDGFKNDKKLLTFKELLELLAKELGGHMKKEELILFPYIRKMVATQGVMELPRFKSVENPIDMMIHEHNTAFQLLSKIRNTLEFYKVDDSDTVEVNEIVLLMKDLDCDLGLHLHLENNILFPKAISYEKIKLNL